jgi:hypothetical protein
MAKPARGLPEGFSLDLPDEGPVDIGDFLDEAPPALAPRKPQKAPVPVTPELPIPQQAFRPQIVPEREETVEAEPPARPLPRRAKATPSVIRYQLNLTPKAKKMLEELVEYVCMYSPETDARVSEVFQGVVGLLHNAMEELELAELPRRGAWGSVTAKNFPGALGETFEQAILRSARKRGVGP